MVLIAGISDVPKNLILSAQTIQPFLGLADKGVGIFLDSGCANHPNLSLTFSIGDNSCNSCNFICSVVE